MITAARILAVLFVGWPVAVSADHELENRDTARGQVLYQEHCASCHGVETRGTGELADPGSRRNPARAPRTTRAATPGTMTTACCSITRSWAARR